MALLAERIKMFETGLFVHTAKNLITLSISISVLVQQKVKGKEQKRKGDMQRCYLGEIYDAQFNILFIANVTNLTENYVRLQ